jgi:hypothetical protein
VPSSSPRPFAERKEGTLGRCARFEIKSMFEAIYQEAYEAIASRKADLEERLTELGAANARASQPEWATRRLLPSIALQLLRASYRASPTTLRG